MTCFAGGFPAHAGMDRIRPGRQYRLHGLPRTRGDGPGWRPAPASRPRASPHTRGWTDDRHHPRLNQHGFPAHAGDGPRRDGDRQHALQLPRTRGDGPAPIWFVCDRSLASPHTRGWTSPGDPPAQVRSGFPAHAGMDRAHARGSAHARGLPRTRGDGPVSSVLGVGENEASPHTRGWTLSMM